MISRENDEEIKKIDSDEECVVVKKNWFSNLRKWFRFKSKKPKKLVIKNKFKEPDSKSSNNVPIERKVEFLSGFGEPFI